MLLEKMLQSQGFGSRKHCQSLIKNSAVSVAGTVVTDPKMKLNLEDLLYTVHGEEYRYREKVYIALHKPKGYECSHQATHHLSVFELFDSFLLARGLQSVGRLDQDTSGLLLLTDDGQFLQALTHPKKHVPKVYVVHTADALKAEDLDALRQGVELRNENGVFAATDVTQLSSHSLHMTVHQGIYHQVKRMLAACGHKVVQLHRQQMGQLVLTLTDQAQQQQDTQCIALAEGEWCYLDATQIAAARQASEQSAL